MASITVTAVGTDHLIRRTLTANAEFCAISGIGMAVFARLSRHGSEHSRRWC